MASFTCLTEDSVLIAGDLFAAKGRRRGTVILAHGLPRGTPPPVDGTDEGYPGLARRIVEYGFNVAIFNFRGTGMSDGHLEIDQWPKDLKAVLDYLDQTEEKQARYAVVGFSAGAAAAILLSAREERIDPLITMAAPADYSFLPIDTDPHAWFAWYQEMGMIKPGYKKSAEEWAASFNNVVPREAIGQSKARQVFILHGTADDLVPVTHAGILDKAAGDKGNSILIAGGIHQMRRDERAINTLLDLLQRTHP